MLKDSSMPIFCDNCGFQNRDSAKFCQGCGGKIIATTAGGTLKAGVILNKTYEIKSLIKQGGMGAVYQAFNRKFDTVCAVKELLSISTTPQNQQYMIDSFEREAKILHKLRHPNIPVVIDYFIEAGRYYLVMDYIDGKDLDTLMGIYPGGVVSEDAVIEWAKEILDALDYLHSQSPPVIYRDMKPANIMLRSSDQKIVLIDFGIARTVTPGSQTEKTRIGTSGYAPVEQCRGKVEPRSDIYALGATMHHLLTGIEPLPFRFEPLRKINSKITSGLEQIVMRALKDNLQERFSTAKDMKEAIVNLSSPKVKVNSQTPPPPQISKVIHPQAVIKPASPPHINHIMTADDWNRKGVDYVIHDNFEEAIRCYDKALEINNKYYKAWNNKGLVLHKQGKIIEAIKCYDKALEIAPKNKDSLHKKKYALRSYGIVFPTQPIQKSYTPIQKSYIEPEMVYINGGTFQMGSNNCSADEKPIHNVTVSSFYIGKYTLTNKEYSLFETSYDDNPGDNLPVVNVNWKDAVEYCKWLSSKTGSNYRLPTEAEWEYACRAGSTTKYYWGNSMDGNYCWYYKNSYNQVHPVGKKMPNKFGLYDMSGNVWEWCSDWYGKYPSGSVNNPTGSKSGSYRIVRGGSWGLDEDAIGFQSAERNYDSPDDCNLSVGFRLAMSAP